MWYELLPDPEVWGQRQGYTLTGLNRWSLPGLRCYRCGAWSTLGLAYPSIDLSTCRESRRFSPRLSKRVELDSLIEILRTDYKETRHLSPGTDLGPSVLKLKGKPQDLMWSAPWALFGRKDALDKIAAKMPLPNQLVQAQVDKPLDLYEIEVECVQLRVPPGPKCPECGRPEEPGPIIPNFKDVGERVLVRDCEIPTVIYAHEKLIKVLQEESITGWNWKPSSEVVGLPAKLDDI